MNEKLRRKLERLHDDFAEIKGLSLRNYGFGIISSNNRLSMTEARSWAFLEPLVQHRTGDAMALRVPPYSFDPFPDGNCCIWWWGDVDGVARLREWANRFGALLGNVPDSFPGIGPGTNYHRALDAIVAFALNTSELSESARKWTILDSRTKLESTPLPAPLRQRKVRPRFIMQEPAFTAKVFIDGVLSYLLGKLRGPRLTMNVENRTVTLDDNTIAMDEDSFLLVKVLVEGRGIRQTARQIMEKQPLLEGGRRFGRRVDDVQERYKEIGAIIGRSDKPPYGFWIDEEYFT